MFAINDDGKILSWDFKGISRFLIQSTEVADLQNAKRDELYIVLWVAIIFSSNLQAAVAVANQAISCCTDNPPIFKCTYESVFFYEYKSQNFPLIYTHEHVKCSATRKKIEECKTRRRHRLDLTVVMIGFFLRGYFQPD